MTIGIMLLAISIVDGVARLQLLLAVPSIEQTRWSVAFFVANAVAKVLPALNGCRAVCPWVNSCTKNQQPLSL